MICPKCNGTTASRRTQAGYTSQACCPGCGFIWDHSEAYERLIARLQARIEAQENTIAGLRADCDRLTQGVTFAASQPTQARIEELEAEVERLKHDCETKDRVLASEKERTKVVDILGAEIEQLRAQLALWPAAVAEVREGAFGRGLPGRSELAAVTACDEITRRAQPPAPAPEPAPDA